MTERKWKCPKCKSEKVLHYQHDCLCFDCRNFWSKIMGRILQRSEPLEEKEFNALVKKWSKLSCPKCESQNLKWLYRHDSKDFYRCCKCLLEFADLEKYKKDQELEEFHRMKSDALIHHN